MVRTQIQFTEDQVSQLKRAAAERNVSVSQVVREAVDAHVDDAGSRRRVDALLATIGKYRSGLTDVSVNHDNYLAEDFAD